MPCITHVQPEPYRRLWENYIADDCVMAGLNGHVLLPPLDGVVAMQPGSDRAANCGLLLHSQKPDQLGEIAGTPARDAD